MTNKANCISAGTVSTAVTLSAHGLMRVMERCRVNEQQAFGLVRRAWERGKRVHQLPTRRQRDYITCQMTLMHNGWTQMRVYQDYLFIFAPGAILITAYPLPKEFLTRPHFDGQKQQIRNLKKYQRMTPAAIPAC